MGNADLISRLIRLFPLKDGISKRYREQPRITSIGSSLINSMLLHNLFRTSRLHDAYYSHCLRLRSQPALQRINVVTLLPHRERLYASYWLTKCHIMKPFSFS